MTILFKYLEKVTLYFAFNDGVPCYKACEARMRQMKYKGLFNLSQKDRSIFVIVRCLLGVAMTSRGCWYLMLQNLVWNTMEKDPIFNRGFVPYSLEEYREVTQKRIKRLVEYNLNSLTKNTNVDMRMAWIQALGMYDSALYAKYTINAMVKFKNAFVSLIVLTKFSNVIHYGKTCLLSALLPQRCPSCCRCYWNHPTCSASNIFINIIY